MSIIQQLKNTETYCDHEIDVLNFWKNNKVYNTIQQNEMNDNSGDGYDDDEYKFMDGPPFPNGSLHMGHIGVGAIKDTILKHNHKKYKKCLNKLGYDTHGLPIESNVCKLMNLQTRLDIENVGIVDFNQMCKTTIQKYINSWVPLYDIIGRFANFDNVYKTMDANYMETVWWCFNELWKKGLVYKGYKVMPFSYGCQTPLSNFEAGQNYKETRTRSIYVAFQSKTQNNRFYVAWTTTPWTLPSNIALCVNPDAIYVVCVDESGKEYVVCDKYINNLHINIVKTFELGIGSTLVGLEYIALYDVIDFTYHKIIADNYVTTEPSNHGTGIVQIAPAFGEEDSRVCIENNIICDQQLHLVCPVSDEGTFTKGLYKDMLVFDTDKLIIKALTTQNTIIREQLYDHQYPYCYRTETKLLYKASSSMFIDVPKIKDDMLRLNATISWHPKTIGENRFHNWINTAKPWCISRNRFFGTPIPVWMSDDGEMMSIGSVDELMQYATNLESRPQDLHPEFINKVILKSPSGKIMRRVTDIFDCWFESGAVPYGQIHYPFDKTQTHMIDNDKPYLCDFVAEGLDQTRGWFYTLLVLSTAISNKAPFKNVICSGLVLDGSGRKISKKDGNFVDPTELIKKYGADVLRMHLLGSQLVRGEPLKFQEQDLGKLRQRIIPLINGVRFFLEHYINYSNTHGNINTNIVMDDLNIMDKWILNKMNIVKKSIITSLDNYQIDKAIQTGLNFIEDITNWYIKLSRDRLKGNCGLEEWNTSLKTLYNTFMEYINACSTFMPFLSEHLYHHLCVIDNKKYSHESIHMAYYKTEYIEYNFDDKLFDGLQTIAKLLRQVRDKSINHTSVKTPIKSCAIYHHDQSYLDNLKQMIDIIQDEVNCIEFEFQLLDDANVYYEFKPNNKSLGTKYKKDATNIKQFLANATQEYIYANMNNVTLQLDNNIVLHKDDDYEIIKKSKITLNYVELDDIKAVVDMTYDNDTHEQCQIRRFIRDVQNVRKIMKLRPWNKIIVIVQKNHLMNVFEKPQYKILLQTRLGTNCIYQDENDNYEKFVWDNIDGSCVELNFKIVEE